MQSGRNNVVLFVGTQKGLFLVRSDADREHWALEGPHIAGYEVLHAWLDSRDSTTAYAAAHHPVWGSHVYRSERHGREWVSLGQPPSHLKTKHSDSINAVWYLAPGHPDRRDTLYAGIDPPGLFVSHDRGETWAPVDALNDHPTRRTWEPSRGIFSVHSIYLDPRDRGRMYVAVSAGGVYRSRDGGKSWDPANQGVRAENLPERYPQSGHNVHRLVMHPAEPSRLYRQCYNGTYRSDDGAESWVEITSGLPSDFGYAIAVDPHDPDTVYQIPEESSHMRTMVQGKLRVYRSRDAGKHWEALIKGLPQAHAYVTVLREAMDTDGLHPCGVYFGTSGGHLFASPDGGERWSLIANFLPRILSVRAAVLPAD